MADAFGFLLSLSLSGTLVALVVFGLCGLLRQRVSKSWQYYVWLIVLFRLLVPFAPEGHNLIDLAVQSAATAPSTISDGSGQQGANATLAMDSSAAGLAALGGPEEMDAFKNSSPVPLAPTSEKQGFAGALAEL